MTEKGHTSESRQQLPLYLPNFYPQVFGYFSDHVSHGFQPWAITLNRKKFEGGVSRQRNLHLAVEYQSKQSIEPWVFRELGLSSLGDARAVRDANCDHGGP